MDRTISATNTGTITVGKNSIGIYASGTGTGHEAETEIGNTNNLKNWWKILLVFMVKMLLL